MAGLGSLYYRLYHSLRKSRRPQFGLIEDVISNGPNFSANRDGDARSSVRHSQIFETSPAKNDRDLIRSTQSIPQSFPQRILYRSRSQEDPQKKYKWYDFEDIVLVIKYKRHLNLINYLAYRSIPRSGRPPGCKNGHFPKPLLP